MPLVRDWKGFPIVQQQTGGLSLTVLVALLTKWAVDGTASYRQAQRDHHVNQPFIQQAGGHQYKSPYGPDAVPAEQKLLDENKLRSLPLHSDDCQQVDVYHRSTDRQKCAPCEIEIEAKPAGVTLPISLI